MVKKMKVAVKKNQGALLVLHVIPAWDISLGNISKRNIFYGKFGLSPTGVSLSFESWWPIRASD